MFQPEAPFVARASSPAVVTSFLSRAASTLPNEPHRRTGIAGRAASFQNGANYSKWTHIDSRSESVVEYIRMLEMT
jgi:hypothetical protein